MTTADTAGSDIGGVFAAIDNKDAASFVQYLTEDAVFRFGSAPPVRGRQAICEAVDGFFATIAGCRHAIGNSFGKSSTFVCEGQVTYLRHDDSEITVPFANIFEYEGDLIADYKIYVDIAPLYAE